MTAIAKPHYFNIASYDPQTGNLVLSADKATPYTAGPLDSAGVLAILGEKLGNRLLSTPAPAGSGWAFQIEGEWQLWPLKVESLTSHLRDDDGNDLGYVAYAYNPPAGDQVYLDIQARDAVQGDVSMALSVTTNDEGKPSVTVHDGEGTWAGSFDVAPDGKVAFRQGNYEAAKPPAVASTCAILITEPIKLVLGAYANSDYGDAPAYAVYELTQERANRLFELKSLVEANKLASVRVVDGPDWDMEDEFRLQDPELVVTSGDSFYFEDRPKNAGYTIQTRAVSLRELFFQFEQPQEIVGPLYLTDNAEAIARYKEDNDIEDSES